MIQEERGGVGKDLVSLTSLGEGPLRAWEGQKGGSHLRPSLWVAGG